MVKGLCKCGLQNKQMTTEIGRHESRNCNKTMVSVDQSSEKPALTRDVGTHMSQNHWNLKVYVRLQQTYLNLVKGAAKQ